MSKLKQILRLLQQGKSKKEITRITGHSRNTVKKYIRLCEECDFSLNRLLGCEEEELELFFNDPAKPNTSDRYQAFQEQLDYLLSELKRAYVTRKILWIEYKKRNPDGYEYSQFCYHLKEAQKARQVSMVKSHEPGSMLYVDFAGKTWEVYDGEDGKPTQKQVLVATLGYSQYGYVEVVESQKTEDFIAGMNRCLKYYDGVPQGIVTDNFKSAVIKTDRYEPDINRVLEDFANHFGTAIIPTRTAKPKDKAHAENMVKHTYYQIRGPLRNQKFFDLHSLNEAIAEQLTIYNDNHFQGRPYSRYDRYTSEEKATLQPLPKNLFQLKKYRRLKVQKNSHVRLSEDQHHYSVPYAYIGKRVKVIYTNSTVTVYFQSQQIACHIRNKRAYGYTTVADHLPSYFQDYKDRSPAYYLNWAASKSPDLLLIIEKVLAQKKHPEQAYRTCDGILHLTKKVDPDVMKKACRIAVEYQCYQYKFIKTLIENGMTNQPIEQPSSSPIPNHENIRGKSYYQNQ